MALDLRKLPPLKALKGFEAAARLQSIRGAAEELNLTHPAIRHQIQLLEDDLGLKLFTRRGRNVRLTEAGEAFYPVVCQVLGLLVESCEVLRQQAENPPLRLQAYITLSIRWLASRLSEFKKLYPEIDIYLQANNSGWEFDESHADIGLIYSRQPVSEHLHWIDLFPSRVYPVCSPALMEGVGELSVQSLLQYPLLTVSSEKGYWSWDDWFRDLNIDFKPVHSPVVVDTLAVALEMALAGQGIVLVNGPVAEDDIAEGRLTRPVEDETEGRGRWGIVVSERLIDDQRVKLLTHWLQKAAGKA